MRRIIKLDRTHRVVSMILAIAMVLSVIPFSVFAADAVPEITPGVLTTDIGEKSFAVGEATEFTFTTTANDDAGIIVLGSFEFSDPEAIEKLEYLETQGEQAGNWYEFYGDFGPETGFPLTDATSRFRVTFKKAGIYTVEASMKTVDGGTVLCSTSATVVVHGKNSIVTDIDSKSLVVNEPTEFSITTVVQEHEGTLGREAVEFSDPDAVESLEYRDAQGTEWYKFYGIYSVAELKNDSTDYFRVTFNKTGTYTLYFYFKGDATDEMLCIATATVKVKERTEFNFENDSVTIKYGQEGATNAVKDDVDGAEYTYKSDDEKVVKVDEEGILAPVAPGTATITVTRVESDAYVEASASYTVTVEKGDQTISFEEKSYEMINGDNQFVSPEITEKGAGTGAITYSVEEDKNQVVSKIDPETGKLTFTGNTGTVVIRATKEDDKNYNGTYAEYTLTVKEWELDSKNLANYFTVEGEKPYSWYISEVVSIIARDGYELSYERAGENVEWLKSFDLTANGIYVVTFYVKDTKNGWISNQQSVEIRKDDTSPTVWIEHENLSNWEKFLSIITLGLWEPDTMHFTIGCENAISDVAKIEYYIDYGTTVFKSDEDLADTDINWIAYKDGISVEKDKIFVVYAKVTNDAGVCSYARTNGIVFDRTAPEITLIIDSTDRYHGNIPLYSGDVNVQIKVQDAYSGIKEVRYWVICDEMITQEDVLYDFVRDNPKSDNPEYDDLRFKFDEIVTIDAQTNNSCDVVLYVAVTDNADHKVQESIAVDIDVTAPTIDVRYDNNDPYTVDDGRGYYTGVRTATIIITERTEHFDADNATAGIQIKAVDLEGNPIYVEGSQLAVDEEGYLVDISQLFGTITWDLHAGKTPDEDTHTLILRYAQNANYTFDISYSDLAGNGNEKVNTDGETPYAFTVDNDDPYNASVTIDEWTWTKLLEILTFGLFKSETVTVSMTAEDATSPLTIRYYKQDYAMTEVELLDVKDIGDDEWEIYESEFKYSPEERFVLYVKVTDYAGNTIYFRSDGVVIDSKEALVEIKLPENVSEHKYPGIDPIPVYNGNVDVQINVQEQTDKAYSGIKTVEYWVTCDGEETIRKTLYSFEYVRDEGDDSNGGHLIVKELDENGDLVTILDKKGEAPHLSDLKSSFTKTVTIDAQANNSCDVVLYVMVTDNAGNVFTESVKVDIDVTAPTIGVGYDNNSPYKVVDDKGYFPEARTAIIYITERAAHFDADKATAAIKVKAVDVNGDPIVIDDGSKLEVDEEGYLVDVSRLFGTIVWDLHAGATPDQDIHISVLDFDSDANYDFTLSYEDLALNSCTYDEVSFTDVTVAPRFFAVDTNEPTGSVSIDESNIWYDLIEILTFGIWRKDTVDVTGTAQDATTPIESVSYYKTSDVTAKTEEDLKAIADWTDFDGEKGISVPANERFVVYIRIVDYAGNVKFISTNGIIVDDTPPDIERVEPEITITPEPSHGIYNSDVTVAVSVVDPKTGDTEAFAGLKEIRYEVYNLGKITQNGVLYTFDTTDPTHGELLQEWSKADAIVVDKDLNNSNDIRIVVYAVDNAGNENEADCKIMIDVTAPTIQVTYDNNSGDTGFAESVYFKANRTATIVVTERNFDPEMVKLVITNTDGYIPVISEWKTIEDKNGNGDGTTHTATVLFDRDGDYTFEISCTDAAMNASGKVDYGKSLAPNAFTVDKTAPIVSVVYDNNSVRNGNYYRAQRIATITVTEHNFETGRIVISLKATDDGVEIDLPVVSQWSSDGDVHTATITYSADALYVFDFDYTDKAGNAAADIEEQTFYVDKTNPVLSIEKIVDESANNNDGNIGFVMTATDTNFDIFTPVVTAVIKNGDTFETKQLEIGEITDTVNGKVFTVINLDVDGIYRITCTIIDKAGNAYSEVTLEKEDGSKYVEQRTSADVLVTFSVNREGSTFEIDEETAKIVDLYYVQNVKNDIVIFETNADPLKEYIVTLNGKTLVKDTDYTVTEAGGNGEWLKYTYRVNKELFADEGEYTLVISSTDKADNAAFSDVKNATVSFVVDRTAPVVTVSGLTNDGRYQTDSQVVTLIPTDDGGRLKTLVVRLVDENGSVIKELINLSGEALETALESGEGKITFEIDEGLYQNVQIICTDYAVGDTEATNTYDETFTNVSVSSSALMIFWANKPLRWGTIGGVSVVVAGLILLLVLKKRKKKEN